MTREVARAPKQERSRLSFERAQDAVVALLVEHGSDSFTLAEVAERAGVSIGSMYTRVASKDDLILAVQQREMARIEEETRRALDGPPSADVPFPEVVRGLVVSTGELLRSNAGIMRPFMLRANTDPEVARLGKQSSQVLAGLFRARLLGRPDAIRHAQPDRAVRWCFTMVYSVLARYLGLGSSPESAGEGDWDELLDDLAETVTLYLTTPRS
ncbi:AcrR family transcriptional regulator [Thermocatellispora tengchongensis]|uniref:AcrR family transcriptional regulator n=1 Tax=Thermocatellispora tengchongensis TaxID=1073253 RepID=A0A840PCF8_9ACTN|nr:TetR/AcrR family transcriptional regulator [Thermocatellispora tengchongensis]MBB5136669.1 AcrR family transcriptional regulator [Thermocatellispora tengchongensis]